MMHKTGDVIVYTSDNGAQTTLEAVDSRFGGDVAAGCVGLDPQGRCGGACCNKLPAGCSTGFVWREVVC